MRARRLIPIFGPLWVLLAAPAAAHVTATGLAIGTRRGGQASGQYVLGEESRRVSLDFDMPVPSGFLGFIRLGIEHILTGYDHLLFLLALLIGATRLWRVLGVATAFTLAHSITL